VNAVEVTDRHGPAPAGRCRLFVQVDPCHRHDCQSSRAWQFACAAKSPPPGRARGRAV
jgi:hypothetical protein